MFKILLPYTFGSFKVRFGRFTGLLFQAIRCQDQGIFTVRLVPKCKESVIGLIIICSEFQVYTKVRFPFKETIRILLYSEFGYAAAGAGEEYAAPVFGQPANVKAGRSDELPVHSIIIRDVYA